MTEQATQDCTTMSNPTDAHAKLEPFVGTFDTEVKTSDGQESKGMEIQYTRKRP